MCQVLNDNHFLLVIKALNQRKDKRHQFKNHECGTKVKTIFGAFGGVYVILNFKAS